MSEAANIQMDENAQCWVVFSAQADMPWLKVLKPGFRHCSVLVNDGNNWLTIDPLSNYMDVTVHHVPPEFDLPLWMEDRGHVVVKAKMEKPETPAPWGVFTCVEAVKRVLGLHKRSIITPWQLYRYLERVEKGERVHCAPRNFNFLEGDLAWEV